MTEDEIGPVYCALMEELKARVDTIAEIVSELSPPKSEKQHRHNIFNFEGMYLHLRKVCELLSLAVVLVHQKSKESLASKIGKEWRSDRLLDEIGKINSIGFPKTVKPSKWEAASMEEIGEVPAVFTAEELKGLYYECGNLMHVGSLRNILRRQTKELNQDLIREWVAKLQIGLSNHMIVMPSQGRALLARMQDNETGRVSCTFASILR